MNLLSKPQKTKIILPSELFEIISNLEHSSLSEATQRAYRGHCKAFAQWCARLDLPSYPTTPDIVVGWIAYLVQKNKRPSTISQSISAISAAHSLQGLPNLRHSPEVKRALSGVMRTLGVAPNQKEAATAPLVLKMITTIVGNTLKAKRDRALLAFGFAGAFRRSELVALEVSDLQETSEGMLVTIRKSKTDQIGEGQIIGIPEGVFIRPLEYVREWLDAAGIKEGFIFRRLNRHGHILGALSGAAVAEIIKKAAYHAGLDEKAFSAHSLRAGFITSGAEAGNDVLRIAEVSRHKNLEVLRGYVRRANLLKNHAGSSFL